MFSLRSILIAAAVFATITSAIPTPDIASGAGLNADGIDPNTVTILVSVSTKTLPPPLLPMVNRPSVFLVLISIIFYTVSVSMLEGLPPSPLLLLPVICRPSEANHHLLVTFSKLALTVLSSSLSKLVRYHFFSYFF